MIILNDNIRINAGKPVDVKYLSTGNTAYISINAVNTAITVPERHIGLTVNISNVEYWYKTGLTNTSLVLKQSGAIIPTGFITGATNGITVSGQVVKLGGTLTGATTITLGAGSS